MMIESEKLEAGVRNLLAHCTGLTAGDHVTILHEPAAESYYDPELPGIVARIAGTLGVSAKLREMPVLQDAAGTEEELGDVTGGGPAIFLARIGDQLRFRPRPGNARPTICYALSREMLASGFGWAHHDAFEAIRDTLQSLMSAAETIHVTCPRGTDFSGSAPDFSGGADVTLRRFPMLTTVPLPAAGFSGRVALPGFLLGTGSRFYEPYVVEFEGEIHAEFHGRRLIGFSGGADDVRKAEAHYDHVSNLFGIKPDVVHSWHPGIHPGSAYDRRASDDYLRWGGSAFGNPRLLHFHTCGDYAPGEISWNVVDPTICIDGVAVWEDGALIEERVPGLKPILDRYPCAQKVFAEPSREIGM